MLSPDRDRLFRIREQDRSFYGALLPKEHPLLDALELIPWDSFVPELEAFYCPHRGQPAVTPLIMFKLEFLRYFCRLSDREVMLRGQTDVLFRWFLQIPVIYRLPDASLLPKFRGRLGAAGFKKLFRAPGQLRASGKPDSRSIAAQGRHACGCQHRRPHHARLARSTARKNARCD